MVFDPRHRAEDRHDNAIDFFYKGIMICRDAQLRSEYQPDHGDSLLRGSLCGGRLLTQDLFLL